jgi:hypothetical protein
MDRPEDRLPTETLAKSSVRGGEYAWRPMDIPGVIAAARAADLASIGGQPQLRLPNGATCECYWIEVDTHKTVQEGLSWPERVAATASAALEQYKQLISQHDFLAAALAAFPGHVEAFEKSGGDTSEALWFVWYVEAQPGTGNSNVP